MNRTLAVLNARRSTRNYESAFPTKEERQSILHAAMRAPTAGNMMLYSIIEIEDQALKDRLAVTCSNQRFIAKAPWVLVFVADVQKWTDLFRVSDVMTLTGVKHRSSPGLGDLLMACSDALIAAQNAVIAAESMGIGSCYIGDILGQGEAHAELLGLPPHTLPVAMLCLGRPSIEHPLAPRYEKHVVHTNSYRRLDEGELKEVLNDLAQLHAPRGLPARVSNYGQCAYKREFASDSMREMNRSVQWWIDRWQTT